MTQQFSEVGYHYVGAVAPQLLGLAYSVDAHHEAEVTGMAGRHARYCVLEYGRCVGGDVEQLRPTQIRVWRRIAGDVLLR